MEGGRHVKVAAQLRYAATLQKVSGLASPQELQNHMRQAPCIDSKYAYKQCPEYDDGSLVLPLLLLVAFNACKTRDFMHRVM